MRKCVCSLRAVCVPSLANEETMALSRVHFLTAFVFAGTIASGCGAGTSTVQAPGAGGIPAPIASVAPGGTATPGGSATSTPAPGHTAAPTAPGSSATPSAAPTAAATATAPFSLSSVKHVFIVMLENESYSASFGGAQTPYLSTTLPSQGALLEDYYSVGHESLDNYIAMISGQAPSYDTQTDCQDYLNFIYIATLVDGQAAGAGCVFPTNVLNITDELSAKGVTWKAYMEDMGNDPARESATCGHPVLNMQDHTQDAEASDQYATRHNPFMYFHTIVDNPICNTNVVNFQHVATDLSSIATTANYNYFTPNLCDDGHDSPCANGDAGGLPQINTFLASFIPTILASPAFKEDGLLIVTFDEAAVSDASSCCGELPGPNSADPGLAGLGGGVIGAVMLSPFIKPGTVSMMPYNHYALLLTTEDIFRVAPLGYSQTSGLNPLGSDVFTNPGG